LLEDGRAKRQDIVTGSVQGEQVAVRSGLLGGEVLAATPQRLTEGASVQINGEGTK
jgi:hypothetical protein